MTESTAGKGPWQVAFYVGPFNNLVKANRFENLLKKSAGANAKLAKAQAAGLQIHYLP